MAKLNVVIPAVEVTVDVEGKAVTYRKVDRKAQAGDIVKALRRDTDITQDAFYGPLYESGGGQLGFKDNVNDFRFSILKNRAETMEVYAPISEPTPEPAMDTITFEGAIWRKVDRDVREGDAIKFTDDDRSSYLTGAELYVVNYVDRVGDPRITDDDEDGYDAGSDDYEVYEKVSDSAAQWYREVKRKAAVGERIKITYRDTYEDRYNDGAEFIVKDADADGDVYVDTDGGDEDVLVGRSEYVVLEPVTKDAEPAQPERLKVGEYARVVEDQRTSENDPISSVAYVGDIVEIAEDDGSGVPFRVRIISGRNKGEDSAWARPFALVRATDEEVAAAKRADLIAQFSVGDSVKLTPPDGASPRYGRGEVENGDVGKVTEVTDRSIYVDFPAQSGRRADPTELTKLTAEEAAEIEREQAEEAAKRAEEAKWAKIGRKVNEFKRGDIVEIVRKGDSVRGVGAVEDVGYRAVGVRMASKAYTYGTEYHGAFMNEGDSITLIVPVEQRFDRVEEVDAA